MTNLERHLKDLVSAAVAEESQKTLVASTSGAERKYNLNMQNRAAAFKRQAHRKIVNLFAEESN